MAFASKDICFLLGAGASAEADIPTSETMIKRIESLLVVNNSWRKYAEIYNHVKSSIYYASGLRGQYGNHVSYNIETLVNTLNELERNEDHPLFPFIASWDQRFVGLAGHNFKNIRSFSC